MITYWRLVGRNKWVNLQLGALAAIASSPCSCSFIWLEGSAKEFELIILYFIYWVGKICERNWFDLVPDRARLWIEHSLGSGSDLNAILAQDLTHLDRSFLLVPSLSHPLLNQGEFPICFAGVCHLILLEDVHFILWSWLNLFHLWSWFISVISIELIQLSDWCEQIPLGTWSLVDLISFIWSDQQTEQSAAFFNRSD